MTELPAVGEAMATIPEGAGLLRVDHVAIAVADLREGVALFGHALGGRFLFGGDNDHQGIRIAQFVLPGGMKIELITALRDDAGVARFLERRGPGVHHITMIFIDVEVAVAHLEAAGYELVDTDLTNPVWREAYVRPRSGCGTLLQLADTTIRWDTPANGIVLDDVLAGRVVFTEDEQAVLREQAEPRR
jgi:methylmalonyl-CoA/ethylmalonyl-CoA epimerase